MTVTDKIKDKVVSHITGKILTLIAVLLGLAWVALKPFISQRVLPELSKELLAGLVVGVLILLLFAVSYILVLRKKVRPKFKYRFGVYWDKNGRAVCPHCEVLLQDPSRNVTLLSESTDRLKCGKCGKLFLLQNLSGAYLELRQARELAMTS